LLNDALQELGDREGVACREMTKPHEEFLRGRLSSIRDRLAKREAVKGEVTLLVAGHRASSPGEGVSGEALASALLSALQEPGARVSAVSRSVAKRFGVPKNQVYEAALEIQNEVDRTPNKKGEDHGQA
jgi:16S rRNA (cytidine1402-2'-O)-methyltransferase